MIYVAIPTGERAEKAAKCIDAWQDAGFGICIITWDEKTASVFLCVGKTRAFKTIERWSFAKNQNFIARELWGSSEHGFFDWARNDCDAIICGADDLFPMTEREAIQLYVDRLQGYVLWAKDGLFNTQPTHPVITRAWYEKHGTIFDECFHHNFVDTDLAVRTAEAGELVKCPGIEFDHRHPFKTGEKRDSLHKYGNAWFKADQVYFNLKHRDKNVSKILYLVPEDEEIERPKEEIPESQEAATLSTES